jgi:hypothetical protein
MISFFGSDSPQPGSWISGRRPFRELSRRPWPLFILVYRHCGQAASNLRGPIRSDKKMPRRPECSISTHVMRNKLHFRFMEGPDPKPFVKRLWH